MLKIFVRIWLLMAVPLTAFAQSADTQRDASLFYTRQPCDQFEKILEIVEDRYQEQPLFLGKSIQFDPQGQSYTGGSMLFVNQTSGTWSLVTLYGDGTACMTAVGTDFEPYSG